jgi:cell division septation protein DedD
VINVEPVAAITRVVCAWCDTAYEVVPVDGEVQTFLPPGVSAVSPITQASTEGRKGFVLETFDDVLMIPQEAAEPDEESEFQGTNEQPLILEELFSTLESGSPTLQEANEPQSASAPVELPAPTEEGASLSAHVTETPESPAMPEGISRKTEHASEPVAANYDNYAVGVRLLKLSPVWLLIASASFVAAIFLFSSVAKPVGEAETLTPTEPVLLNQATNQGARAVAVEQVSESSKPASPEVEPRTVADDTKVEEAKIRESKVEETKVETAAAPKPESNVELSGKFTVQVGSYNDASEANARVSVLRAAGFEARSAAVEIPKRGTWYRVQAGSFETREEATRFGAQLRAKGVAESVIVAAL